MPDNVRGLTIIKVVSDYAKASAVISRVADIAKRFDGVLSWEVFGDENSGTLLLISSYESEEAAIGWEKAVTAAGLRPEMGANLALEADYALTPIKSEAGVAMMEEAGSIQTHLVAAK